MINTIFTSDSWLPLKTGTLYSSIVFRTETGETHFQKPALIFGRFFKEERMNYLKVLKLKPLYKVNIKFHK